MDRRTRTQSVVVAVDNPGRIVAARDVRAAPISPYGSRRKRSSAPPTPSSRAAPARTCSWNENRGSTKTARSGLGLSDGRARRSARGRLPRQQGRGDRRVSPGVPCWATNTKHGLPAKNRRRTKPDTDPATRADRRCRCDRPKCRPTDRPSRGPRITGRVRRVLVRPSQRVEVGQVMAEIESLELQTVQLDLLQSISRLRLAEQSLARLEPLGDRNITPRRQIWELQNERDALRHDVVSLKRRLSFFRARRRGDCRTGADRPGEPGSEGTPPREPPDSRPGGRLDCRISRRSRPDRLSREPAF